LLTFSGRKTDEKEKGEKDRETETEREKSVGETLRQNTYYILAFSAWVLASCFQSHLQSLDLISYTGILHFFLAMDPFVSSINP
jgi:hypothetical protein